MPMTLRHPTPSPTPAPRTLPSPAAPALDALTGLGLDALELEAAIVALVDRDELAAPEDRARLARVRLALELELGRTLAR